MLAAARLVPALEHWAREHWEREHWELVHHLVMVLAVVPGSRTAAEPEMALSQAAEKVLPKVQGSANSPRAKARSSVPDAAQDVAQGAARGAAPAGGRGSSTGRSAEGGTPVDGAQPAA